MSAMQNLMSVLMGYQPMMLGEPGQASPFSQLSEAAIPIIAALITKCWVAAEIFGGWDMPKTRQARYYISNIAPDWFRNFYLKYGERIAKFIHNKSLLKLMLRPLFEHFAYVGSVAMSVAIS